jgi:hypothetical protein
MGKFLVRHYHDKRLKPYEGLGDKIHPVYMSISYDQATHNIRSKLWDELVAETYNGRLYTFNDNNGGEQIKIESYLTNDSLFNKPIFEEFCSYEADCITRIKDHFFPDGQGLTVKRLLKYYSYYGADGLKMISKNLLVELMSSNIQSLMFNVFVESLLNQYNPKSVVLFLEEAKYLSSTRKDETEGNKTYVSMQLLSSHLQRLMAISNMKLGLLTNSYNIKSFSVKELNDMKHHGFDLFYQPAINFFSSKSESSDLFGGEIREFLIKYLDPIPKF